MDRKLYLADDMVGLYEYIDTEDDFDCYNCWNDEETQSGYNCKMTETFEEWKNDTGIQLRFISTIVRLSDNANIGVIFVSSESTPPDLAIMIYKPYRKQGYGTAAFALGVKYCFENLKLNKISAGCYSHNTDSMKILEKCGFLPHIEGNIEEKHYLTGKEIIQLGFVKFNTVK